MNYVAKKKKMQLVKDQEVFYNIHSPHDEHRSSGPRPAKLCLDQ